MLGFGTNNHHSDKNEQVYELKKDDGSINKPSNEQVYKLKTDDESINKPSAIQVVQSFHNDEDKIFSYFGPFENTKDIKDSIKIDDAKFGHISGAESEKFTHILENKNKIMITYKNDTFAFLKLDGDTLGSATI